MKYILRLYTILYYFCNAFLYKRLDFKAAILPSVRIAGKKFISIGAGSTIQRQGWLLALQIDETFPELIIGNGCAIGDFSHITAVRSVRIEEEVLIANNVYISDNLHGYEDIHTPVIRQPVVFKAAVRIGSGAWIGENVCIIGASIGKNSVIGANSVVTKDIPDYCIAVGSPAKVIKQYNPSTRSWVKTDSDI